METTLLVVVSWTVEDTSVPTRQGRKFFIVVTECDLRSMSMLVSLLQASIVVLEDWGVVVVTEEDIDLNVRFDPWY